MEVVRHSFEGAPIKPHIPTGHTIEKMITQAREYIAEGSQFIILRTISDDEDIQVANFIAEANATHPKVRIEKRRHSFSY